MCIDHAMRVHVFYYDLFMLCYFHVSSISYIKQRFGGLSFGETQHSVVTGPTISSVIGIIEGSLGVTLNVTSTDADKIAEGLVRSNNAKVCNIL